MRKIRFRGKIINNNEWVYGNLISETSALGKIKKTFINNPISGIVCDNGYPLASMIIVAEVEPDSVGQYTGLKDKNGVEIYEGDIIRTTFPNCTAAVVWEQDTVRNIGYTIENERKIVYVDRVDRNDKSAVEVIGNIYENLELLEDK